MKKQLIKLTSAIVIMGTFLNLTGCAQSPVRNPFAGRVEPKLGELPALSANSLEKVQVNWSTSLLGKQDRFSKLKPLVYANNIFAADHAGKVVALAKESGKKHWTVNTGKKFIAGPTLAGNILLLTTKDAYVVALDAATGHQLWEKKVTSEVLAPPASSNGTVLVHAIDGTVMALSAKTGEELWQVAQSTPSLTLRYSSAPIIANNVALVGFAAGKLLAFNLENGLIEWERVISIPRGRSELQRMVDISADPIVIGKSAYVVTYQGKLAAVDITGGDLLWERDISAYQDMAFDNEHLYVTDNDYNLWAINRHTGETMWKQTVLASRYITGPAVINDKVIVADREGYLHFLAANNGHLLERLRVSGKVYQGPIAMEHELIVSSHNGKLAVISCTQRSA